MIKDFVYCPFRKTDCFAYEYPSGVCDALHDTDFGLKKECPFYKNTNQHAVEMIESKKRLRLMKQAKEALEHEREDQSSSDGLSEV